MFSWLRRHFVPQEGNDYKPHALQTTALVGMMALVLVTFATANLQSIVWTSSNWLVSTVLPAVVIAETNTARSEEALSPLEHNKVLDQVAKMKAQDMVDNDYFAHWSPSGISPWYWFEKAGYRYGHAGENLAVHFTDSDAVVKAWLDSPTHRANIMDEKYTEIGIGTAKGQFEGQDTVFVVQVFGTPLETPSETATPAIENSVAAATAVPADVAVTEVAPQVAGAETDASQDSIVATDATSLTQAGTVVRESFVSTDQSANQMSAVDQSIENKSASQFGRLLTSPRMILQVVYSVIGLFVLLVLLVATVLEWRRHHPIQLAYSVGLLAVMILLFQLHLVISGGITIA